MREMLVKEARFLFICRAYFDQLSLLSNITPKKLVVRNRENNAACKGGSTTDLSRFVQAIAPHFPAHVSGPGVTGSTAMK